MSQIFASGAQSIGVSATASFLSMNIQDWFPLRLTGWISLQSMGLKNLLKCHISKASILWHSAFFIVQLSHPYMTTGKTIPLTRLTFVGKVVSLLFNMWSRWETWVQSLGWDDRLEKGKTTHSSILVCRIPWTVGSQGVRHDWATFKKKKKKKFGHSFSTKEQVSFNFMAAVTICSDFGAPQNKVSHHFHCFPTYLPWYDRTRSHDLSFLNAVL